MSIFKKGDRVNCPVYGDGTVINLHIAVFAGPESNRVIVKFDMIDQTIHYTMDGRLYSDANITLRHIEDPFEGLPEWVSYIATDIDGNMFAYENEPIKDERGYWRCNRGEVKNIKWNKNWKSSLIKRHK